MLDNERTAPNRHQRAIHHTSSLSKRVQETSCQVLHVRRRRGFASPRRANGCGGHIRVTPLLAANCWPPGRRELQPNPACGPQPGRAILCNPGPSKPPGQRMLPPGSPCLWHSTCKALRRPAVLVPHSCGTRFLTSLCSPPHRNT